YPALTAAFRLAGRRLRNRIVHASMSPQFVEGRRVSERLLHYHDRPARRGVAMIVTEPLGMWRGFDVPTRVRVWKDADTDGLERWADAVESQGCRLLGQIVDRGRGRNVPGRVTDAMSASVLPDDLSWSVPRAFTIDGIQELVEQA